MASRFRVVMHDLSHLVNRAGCDQCDVPQCRGEFALGPLYFRPIYLYGDGDMLPLHAHPRAHVSIVLLGRVRATMVGPDGVPQVHEYAAGHPTTSLIHVPAGVLHEFVAVGGPAITVCTFAHYDGQGRPAQDYSPAGEDAGAYA